MERGLTLVDLLLSITLASVLILTLMSVYSLIADAYRETKGSWYCMQSLRSAVVRMDLDLKQCACLLPQDMKIVCGENALFIAGVPVTSSHRGISVHRKVPPPYFSTIRSLSDNLVTLDLLDIDFDGSADFWADLGIITESGAGVISHGYSRGDPFIPLTSAPRWNIGERAVPAVHYEVKEDGLYRNNQLLAEAIRSFESSMNDNDVTVVLKACSHGKEKILSYTYRLQ